MMLELAGEIRFSVRLEVFHQKGNTDGESLWSVVDQQLGETTTVDTSSFSRPALCTKGTDYRSQDEDSIAVGDFVFEVEVGEGGNLALGQFQSPGFRHVHPSR